MRRGTRLGRRAIQLIARNGNGVRRGARGSPASFANEAGNVQRRETTVVAALHQRGRRLTMVAAIAGGRGARMTPELAEQRRCGRGSKRQHDRKESYSKHDTLETSKGQEESQPADADRAAIFAGSAPFPGGQVRWNR